ncbi:unnamed protein product [Prorocentrum cordatum]|uniref:Uncharacterized protein n=1 Tax=Prorocentrum cordatum TaxID=2364126 RepID=A0ABN9U7Q0_9DINO|nr:unnamed protein product [Polarella glacialis]
MHQLPRFQRQRLTSEHLSVVWLEVPPKTHCTGCNCWGPLGRAPAGAGPRPRSLAARRIRSGRCPQSAGSSGSGVGETLGGPRGNRLTRRRRRRPLGLARGAHATPPMSGRGRLNWARPREEEEEEEEEEDEEEQQ